MRRPSEGSSRGPSALAGISGSRASIAATEFRFRSSGQRDRPRIFRGTPHRVVAGVAIRHPGSLLLPRAFPPASTIGASSPALRRRCPRRKGKALLASAMALRTQLDAVDLQLGPPPAPIRMSEAKALESVISDDHERPRLGPSKKGWFGEKAGSLISRLVVSVARPAATYSEPGWEATIGPSSSLMPPGLPSPSPS